MSVEEPSLYLGICATFIVVGRMICVRLLVSGCVSGYAPCRTVTIAEDEAIAAEGAPELLADIIK